MTKYCVPEYIIMHQDSTFMSSLMNYLFKKLDIKNKNCSTIQSSITAGGTWD